MEVSAPESPAPSSRHIGAGPSPRSRRHLSMNRQASSVHEPAPDKGPHMSESPSPSQRELFDTTAFDRALPILTDGEAQAVGSVSRLPPIDLHLPRLRTPALGTRGVQSGLTAKANSSARMYMSTTRAAGGGAGAG